MHSPFSDISDAEYSRLRERDSLFWALDHGKIYGMMQFVEQGIGGEKINAKTLLDKYLQKNGYTLKQYNYEHEIRWRTTKWLSVKAQ